MPDVETYTGKNIRMDLTPERSMELDNARKFDEVAGNVGLDRAKVGLAVVAVAPMLATALLHAWATAYLVVKADAPAGWLALASFALVGSFLGRTKSAIDAIQSIRSARPIESEPGVSRE